VLGYVTVGTNDFEAALTFYDQLISELGGNRAFASPTGQFYSFAAGTLFGILRPYDERPASGGNGSMCAFKVSSPADVDRVYARALRLGASDEGKPGPRGGRGFYGSYFRDTDGNKLCVYHM
jgi:catechol 2,3-dioxygenase-like lactoylglutathione lyase family enzyme